jgi:hypothetical protein
MGSAKGLPWLVQLSWYAMTQLRLGPKTRLSAEESPDRLVLVFLKIASLIMEASFDRFENQAILPHGDGTNRRWVLPHQR